MWNRYLKYCFRAKFQSTDSTFPYKSNNESQTPKSAIKCTIHNGSINTTGDIYSHRIPIELARSVVDKHLVPQRRPQTMAPSPISARERNRYDSSSNARNYNVIRLRTKTSGSAKCLLGGRKISQSPSNAVSNFAKWMDFTNRNWTNNNSNNNQKKKQNV